MPEITPSGADPLTQETTRVTTPEFGSVESLTFNGPVSQLETKEAEYLAETGITGEVASMELRHRAGQGSLRVNFRRVWLSIDPENQSVQELNAFDVVRPIYLAPYFSTMTNAQILAVRSAFENQLTGVEFSDASASWTTLQDRLYGHLTHGAESYLETAYELMITWRTTSTAQLNIASSNPNEVVTRPALSGPLDRMIDELPAGEWLKKPTVVQSEGRGQFMVRTSYQWAKEWSVVYGGSFTGD